MERMKRASLNNEKAIVNVVHASQDHGQSIDRRSTMNVVGVGVWRDVAVRGKSGETVARRALRAYALAFLLLWSSTTTLPRCPSLVLDLTLQRDRRLPPVFGAISCARPSLRFLHLARRVARRSGGMAHLSLPSTRPEHRPASSFTILRHISRNLQSESASWPLDSRTQNKSSPPCRSCIKTSMSSSRTE